MWKPSATEIVIYDVTINAGVPFLLMWIFGRFVGPRTAMVIGGLATAFVLFMVVGVYRDCSAPPIYVPSGGSTGEAAIFRCDGPVGYFLYLFIWRSGPISAALLLAATLFQLRRWLRQRKVGHTSFPANGI